MSRRAKRHAGIAAMVTAVILLLTAGLAFGLEPAVKSLGEVSGKGKAEMQTFDRWVTLDGKSYPLPDGAGFRTAEGTMTMTLKDDVKIEVGKNTECDISGSKGNYRLDLKTGAVKLSVPQGVSLVVATRCSEVQVPSGDGSAQKGSLKTGEHTRGVVIADATGTKAISISGTLVVRRIGGAETVVAAGKTVYMADAENGACVAAALPASASGSAATAPGGASASAANASGGASASAVAAVDPPSHSIGGAAMFGGAVAGEAAAMAGLKKYFDLNLDHEHGQQPASPSKP